MQNETPAMYGPDIFEPEPMAEIYHSLRRRANELGFVTVGEALDALGKVSRRSRHAGGGPVPPGRPYIVGERPSETVRVGDPPIAYLDNRPQ